MHESRYEAEHTTGTYKTTPIYETWNGMKYYVNVWHCRASLSKSMCRMWTSCMHGYDCYQNVTEPQATEYHTKSTNEYNTGTVSQT